WAAKIISSSSGRQAIGTIRENGMTNCGRSSRHLSTRRNCWLALWTLAVGCVCCACARTTEPTMTAAAALSSLDSAEALWRSRRPLSYVVVEERFCECGGNPIAINATRRQGASIPSDVEELVRATYAGTDT